MRFVHGISIGIAAATVFAGGTATFGCGGNSAEPTSTTAIDGGQGSEGGRGPESGTSNHCALFEREAAADAGVGGAHPGDAPCNGDFGTTASASCPTRDMGFCSSQGVCTRCGDCAVGAGRRGTACSSEEGLCGTPCGEAGACPAGEYCSGGACVPQRPNDGKPFLSTVSAKACAEAAIRCESGFASLGRSGSPSTGSCFCGKPNGAACASGAECSMGICAADGKCGAFVGEACDPSNNRVGRSPCRSDACRADTCVCAARCTDDSSCGDAASGQVCDTKTGLCIHGCRAHGGNGCPATETCTSTGNAIGECTSPCGSGCVLANGVCRDGVCTIRCGVSECQGTTISCDKCVIECEGVSSCQSLRVVATTSATLSCTGEASCEDVSCSGGTCDATCGPSSGCGPLSCDAGVCSGRF